MVLLWIYTNILLSQEAQNSQNALAGKKSWISELWSSLCFSLLPCPNCCVSCHNGCLHWSCAALGQLAQQLRTTFTLMGNSQHRPGQRMEFCLLTWALKGKIAIFSFQEGEENPVWHLKAEVASGWQFRSSAEEFVLRQHAPCSLTALAGWLTLSAFLPEMSSLDMF